MLPCNPQCCSGSGFPKTWMRSRRLEIPQWMLDARPPVCIHLFVLEFKDTTLKWALGLRGAHLVDWRPFLK